MRVPLFKDSFVLYVSSMLKELKTIFYSCVFCACFLLSLANAMEEESLEGPKHAPISSSPPSVEEQLQWLEPFISKRKAAYSFAVILGAPSPNPPPGFYLMYKECLYIDSAVPEATPYRYLCASFNDPEHLSILIKYLKGSMLYMHLDPAVFKCSEHEIKYPELLFSLLKPYGQFELIPTPQFIDNKGISIHRMNSLMGFPIQYYCQSFCLSKEERYTREEERLTFFREHFCPYVKKTLENYFYDLTEWGINLGIYWTVRNPKFEK